MKAVAHRSVRPAAVLYGIIRRGRSAEIHIIRLRCFVVHNFACPDVLRNRFIRVRPRKSRVQRGTRFFPIRQIFRTPCAHIHVRSIQIIVAVARSVIENERIGIAVLMIIRIEQRLIVLCASAFVVRSTLIIGYFVISSPRSGRTCGKRKSRAYGGSQQHCRDFLLHHNPP